MSSISTRVTQARNKKGWSQGKLGEAVGTSQQQIANIENGTTKNSKYFLPIAKVLGLSYDWLLYGDDKPTLTPTEIKDNEDMITVAVDALGRAISSMKVINQKSGKDPLTLDEELLKRAFEISMKGSLSGDFVTSALEMERQDSNVVRLGRD